MATWRVGEINHDVGFGVRDGIPGFDFVVNTQQSISVGDNLITPRFNVVGPGFTSWKSKDHTATRVFPATRLPQRGGYAPFVGTGDPFEGETGPWGYSWVFVTGPTGSVRGFKARFKYTNQFPESYHEGSVPIQLLGNMGFFCEIPFNEATHSLGGFRWNGPFELNDDGDPIWPLVGVAKFTQKSIHVHSKTPSSHHIEYIATNLFGSVDDQLGLIVRPDPGFVNGSYDIEIDMGLTVPTLEDAPPNLRVTDPRLNIIVGYPDQFPFHIDQTFELTSFRWY